MHIKALWVPRLKLRLSLSNILKNLELEVELYEYLGVFSSVDEEDQGFSPNKGVHRAMAMGTCCPDQHFMILQPSSPYGW